MKPSELLEGINDPAIFKAVFIIGGPGSGKSAVNKLMALSALGFVSVNSDEAFTHLLKKTGLSLKMPPEEQEQRSAVRSRAKEITATKMKHALDGRLGVVIDGTGEDYRKVESIYTNLSELGYESYLVVVYANLDTAKRRNAKRERSVPEDVLEHKWYGVQRNMDNFLTMFDNSMIIDNNGSLADLMPQVTHAYKVISRWSSKPPKLPAALEWIEDQQLDNTTDNTDAESEEVDEPEQFSEPEHQNNELEKPKKPF